jgi:hypothetical protein
MVYQRYIWLTMRPIINNPDSATYKVARWLSQKYKSFQKFESSSIKYTQDLVDKIKNMRIDWFHLMLKPFSPVFQ